MAEAQGRRHHRHRAPPTVDECRKDDISTCGRRPCGTGTVGQEHTTRVTRTPFNNILIENSYVTGGRGAYCLLFLNFMCAYMVPTATGNFTLSDD